MKITKRKVLYTIYAVIAVILIVGQVQKYRHKTMDAEIAQIESGTAVLYALDESGDYVQTESGPTSYSVDSILLPGDAQVGDVVTVTYAASGMREGSSGEFDAVISIEKK